MLILISKCFWWLFRATLVIAKLTFFPKIFGGGVDLWMVLCRNMNAGWVVGILWGGGDTRTLSYAKVFVWTFRITGDRAQKLSTLVLVLVPRTIAGAWATWWNFHDLIFYYKFVSSLFILWCVHVTYLPVRPILPNCLTLDSAFKEIPHIIGTKISNNHITE